MHFHRLDMTHPIRELLALIVGFLVSIIVLMESVDAFFGSASDAVGGVLAFLAFVPALWLAVRVAGRRPLGQLLAAPDAPNRRAAKLALAVALPPMGVAVVAGIFLVDGHRSNEPLWQLALVLLARPVMAMAEELLFRAWLPQFIGFWTRNVWVAFLLPVPLFALIHAPSTPLEWANHLVSGTCFALLALRARSVVASTIVHAASNMALSVLAFATSYSDGPIASVLLAKSVVLVVVTAIIWAKLGSRDVAAAEREGAEAYKHDREHAESH